MVDRPDVGFVFLPRRFCGIFSGKRAGEKRRTVDSNGKGNRIDEISKGLAELGIAAAADDLARIERYLAELERWNVRYGFVRADADDLVRYHLLDSLAGLPLLESLVPPAGSVLDLGSGAGFPGLPLALFLPDRRFTLCERKATERAFLSGIVALLALGRVAVADDLRRLAGSSFDAVVFRAVTSLKDAYALVRRLLAPGGILFAYKGKRKTIEAELAGLAGLKIEAAVHPLRPPAPGWERHIVTVRPAPT
jgi:16S rRNA (guanine527-N7)-methyltransferase